MTIAYGTAYGSRRGVLVRSQDTDYTYFCAVCNSLFHVALIACHIFPHSVFFLIEIRCRNDLEFQVKKLIIGVNVLFAVNGYILSCHGTSYYAVKRAWVEKSKRIKHIVVYLVVLINYKHNFVILFRQTSCDNVILLVDKLLIIYHFAPYVSTHAHHATH